MQDNIQDELQVYIQDELQINIEDKLQTDYITTEDDWNERLAKWYNILAQEENNENNILDNDEFDNNFFSLQTHPAIDINAK